MHVVCCLVHAVKVVWWSFGLFCVVCCLLFVALSFGVSCLLVVVVWGMLLCADVRVSLLVAVRCEALMAIVRRVLCVACCLQSALCWLLLFAVEC